MLQKYLWGLGALVTSALLLTSGQVAAQGQSASMDISRTMGMASSAIARTRLPCVKSCCPPTRASLTEPQNPSVHRRSLARMRGPVAGAPRSADDQKANDAEQSHRSETARPQDTGPVVGEDHLVLAGLDPHRAKVVVGHPDPRRLTIHGRRPPRIPRIR